LRFRFTFQLRLQRNFGVFLEQAGGAHGTLALFRVRPAMRCLQLFTSGFLAARCGFFVRPYGLRFSFNIISLAVGLLWGDAIVLVETFAAAIRKTYYHYSALRHLGRLLAQLLYWNVQRQLVVLQVMGRFNRRDRTGRFDLVAGFGSLRRSSVAVNLFTACAYVRTYRGVFGLRVWAR
jgi:hypothetical protein